MEARNSIVGTPDDGGSRRPPGGSRGAATIGGRRRGPRGTRSAHAGLAWPRPRSCSPRRGRALRNRWGIHRVHEVVGRVHAAHRRRERLRIQDVSGDDLGLRGGSGGKRRRTPRQAPQRVPRLSFQPAEQTSPDVPGRPGEQNGRRAGHLLTGHVRLLGVSRHDVCNLLHVIVGPGRFGLTRRHSWQRQLQADGLPAD